MTNVNYFLEIRQSRTHRIDMTACVSFMICLIDNSNKSKIGELNILQQRMPEGNNNSFPFDRYFIMAFYISIMISMIYSKDTMQVDGNDLFFSSYFEEDQRR